MVLFLISLPLSQPLCGHPFSLCGHPFIHFFHPFCLPSDLSIAATNFDKLILQFECKSSEFIAIPVFNYINPSNVAVSALAFHATFHLTQRYAVSTNAATSGSPAALYSSAT